jgi:hypothetical protein
MTPAERGAEILSILAVGALRLRAASPGTFSSGPERGETPAGDAFAPGESSFNADFIENPR